MIADDQMFGRSSTRSRALAADRLGKATAKYLSCWAEPEARVAESLQERFGHAVVVPAYGEEPDDLAACLDSIGPGPRGATLVILVLNAREDSPAPVHARNQRTRRLFQTSGPISRLLFEDPPMRLFRRPPGALLLVDRADSGRFLPAGQGVGLARKIGADIAAALYARTRVLSGWIHTTDADARVPTTYLAAAEDAAGPAAAILYPFRHEAGNDSMIAGAALVYEISLRYHVLGLRSAGSPYAFHSIGSTLAIDADCYARVRGFPKRNAAEDFYLLDKLAKVGPIASVSGEPIRLRPRLSDRVPFGTGRSLRVWAGREDLDSFPLEDPAVFGAVGAWLSILRDSICSAGDPKARLAASGTPQVDVLVASLERLGAFDAFRDARDRTGTAGALARRFHGWFDGFRTLRLIHTLRASAFPRLPFRRALAEASFVGRAGRLEGLEQIRGALAREEEAAAG